MDHRIDVSSDDRTGPRATRFWPQKGSPASA